MAAQAAFLSCGFILIGMIIVIIGALALAPALNSQRWPSTEGEILDAAERPASPLRYRYTVRGQRYTGERVSFHRRQPAAALSQHYPPGKSVPVYYDPSDPGRAVLEPGSDLPAYLPLGAGGLFFIIGLILSLLIFFQ